jgi:hypothetical protein
VSGLCADSSAKLLCNRIGQENRTQILNSQCSANSHQPAITHLGCSSLAIVSPNSQATCHIGCSNALLFATKECQQRWRRLCHCQFFCSHQLFTWDPFSSIWAVQYCNRLFLPVPNFSCVSSESEFQSEGPTLDLLKGRVSSKNVDDVQG